jgi:hypothetical protein
MLTHIVVLTARLALTLHVDRLGATYILNGRPVRATLMRA